MRGENTMRKTVCYEQTPAVLYAGNRARSFWFLDKLRHLVENAFLHLERWRGIATRYAKHTASFLAAVQIRCIALWAAIS